MAVTMKYSELSSFQFAQTFQKIVGQPCEDNRVACRIRRVYRAVTEAQKVMREKYKTDIMEKFWLRDEKGEKVPSPAEDIEPGQPDFNPDPAKKAELLAAQETFGTTEVTIDSFPLNLETVKHVKLSGLDIENLKGLFDDREPEEVPAGPGVPRSLKALR